jgi:membrane protein involved in colicin uptake
MVQKLWKLHVVDSNHREAKTTRRINDHPQALMISPPHHLRQPNRHPNHREQANRHPDHREAKTTRHVEDDDLPQAKTFSLQRKHPNRHPERHEHPKQRELAKLRERLPRRILKRFLTLLLESCVVKMQRVSPLVSCLDI